jgi:hypothetical protein
LERQPKGNDGMGKFTIVDTESDQQRAQVSLAHIVHA